MNKKQLLSALASGKRMTREDWPSRAFIEVSDYGNIVTERGHKYNINRSSDDANWEEYTEPLFRINEMVYVESEDCYGRIVNIVQNKNSESVYIIKIGKEKPLARTLIRNVQKINGD